MLACACPSLSRSNRLTWIDSLHAQYGGSFGVCGIHLIQTAGVSERTRWFGGILAEHYGGPRVLAAGCGRRRTAQRGGAERVCHVPLCCQSMQGTSVVPAGPQAGRRRRLGRAARLDVMVRVSYLLWYVTLRLNLASSTRLI